MESAVQPEGGRACLHRDRSGWGFLGCWSLQQRWKLWYQASRTSAKAGTETRATSPTSDSEDKPIWKTSHFVSSSDKGFVHVRASAHLLNSFLKSEEIWGGPKKSKSWTVHLFFRWCLLLFYSGTKHKQWLRVWFFTCQRPVLPGRINFDPFSETWKFFAPKIPMK